MIDIDLMQQAIHHLENFAFDVHIFKEGETYVSYAPALDVSSCGATGDDARRNIRDAVRGFLAASADMGTLDEILQEAGYERDGDIWRTSGMSREQYFELLKEF